MHPVPNDQIKPRSFSHTQFWVRFYAIIGACLFIGWISWARLGSRRFQAQLDLISARHEPVYASDLESPAVPDAQNAAQYYIAAFPTISTTAICPSASNVAYQPYFPPYPPLWRQMTDQAVAADGRALALARQARGFDRADWGTPYLPGLQGMRWMNYLNPARNLANLLADSAVGAYLHNDDAEAFQRIFDLLHLANCVQQRGFVVGRLVGIGIEAMACDRIGTLAAGFHLNSDSRFPRGVSRDDVLKLIADLSDDAAESERIRQTLLAERIATISTALDLEKHSTILRPMAELAGAGGLKEYATLLSACSEPDWADAQAKSAGLSPDQTNIVPDPNPPQYWKFRGLEFVRTRRYLLTEYRVANERRVAAIALAANLYRREQGQWPADLQSLVGKYLLAVPEDPFCAGHRPMGYVVVIAPNGVERPLVYSEPSGSPTNSAPPATPSVGQVTRPEYARQWRDIFDWWMFSAGTVPLGAQALDHQPDQAGEHGK
jgi:hypothetical protein